VPAYVITPDDLEAFLRCRRQWDLGARARRNLEPRSKPTGVDLSDALGAALAVYYFPGMWEWERDVVGRLVARAFERAFAGTERTEWSEVRRERGLNLLSRYAETAPLLDAFVPLRVEADFEAAIPDAEHPSEDLATESGDPVRYRGRIDMLALDADDTLWIVHHRFGDTLERDPDVLLLDERRLSCCWGWEQCFLADRIHGVLYNDVALSANADPITRTVIPRGPTDLYRCGQRLSVVAREMLDPGLELYPSPTEEHCRPCRFRIPCIATNEGIDAEDLLAQDFRSVPDDVVEGRLGGRSWSMGRGAAPYKFGRTPPDRPGTDQ
jgi:hypothetical protein